MARPGSGASKKSRTQRKGSGTSSSKESSGSVSRPSSSASKSNRKIAVERKAGDSSVSHTETDNAIAGSTDQPSDQTTSTSTPRRASDIKLLDAVSRYLLGDDEAFDDIAPIAGRMAYHLALKSVHNSELAEEIAQEALTRLMLRVREISDAKAFKSWFYRVVFNLTHDHYRRTTRRDQLSSTFEDLKKMEIRSRTERLAPAEHEELSQSLNDALSQLDDKQREIFLLKEVEKYSHAEIAEMLGVPEGTVWSRLSYARKKLRRILGRMGYGSE